MSSPFSVTLPRDLSVLEKAGNNHYWLRKERDCAIAFKDDGAIIVQNKDDLPIAEAAMNDDTRVKDCRVDEKFFEKFFETATCEVSYASLAGGGSISNQDTRFDITTRDIEDPKELQELLTYLYDLQDDDIVNFDIRKEHSLRDKLRAIFQSIKVNKGENLPLVVSDFDATLTTEKSPQCHDILLKYTPMEPVDGETTSSHHNGYRGKIIDEKIDEEMFRKQHFFKPRGGWFAWIHRLFENHSTLNSRDLQDAVRKANPRLRDGYKELFDLLNAAFVPTLVVSAGITNIIRQVFDLHGLHHCLGLEGGLLSIDANEIEFQNDSVVAALDGLQLFGDTGSPWASLREVEGLDNRHFRWVCDLKGHGAILHRAERALIVENETDKEIAEATIKAFPDIVDKLLFDKNLCKYRRPTLKFRRAHIFSDISLEFDELNAFDELYRWICEVKGHRALVRRSGKKLILVIENKDDGEKVLQLKSTLPDLVEDYIVNPGIFNVNSSSATSDETALDEAIGDNTKGDSDEVPQVFPPYATVFPKAKSNYDRSRIYSMNDYPEFNKNVQETVFKFENPVCIVMGDRAPDFDFFRGKENVKRLNIGFSSNTSLNDVCDLIITPKSGGLDVVREVMSKILEYTSFVKKTYALLKVNSSDARSVSKWDNYFLKAALESSSPPWESPKPLPFIEANFKKESKFELFDGLKLGPQRIVDVGCGASSTATYLASMGHHVTGLDISQYALQRAKLLEHADLVSWRRCNLMGDPSSLFHDSNDESSSSSSSSSAAAAKKMSFLDLLTNSDASKVEFYGPWIGRGAKSVPVQEVKWLEHNVVLVFMMEEDGLTKMVSSAGEARYYNGKISEFLPDNWNTYLDALDNYMLKGVCKVRVSVDIGQGIQVEVSQFVQAVKRLNDHTLVFMIQDGCFTKMMTLNERYPDMSESKFYIGKISNFSPKRWHYYEDSPVKYALERLSGAPVFEDKKTSKTLPTSPNLLSRSYSANDGGIRSGQTESFQSSPMQKRSVTYVSRTFSDPDTGSLSPRGDVTYDHGYGINKTEDRAFYFGLKQARREDNSANVGGGSSSGSISTSSNINMTGDRFTVMGVADGHGRTDDFSKYVSSVFRFKFQDALSKYPDDIFAAINLAIEMIHVDVQDKFSEKPSGGTTFSVVVIDNLYRPKKRAYVANMGDSPVFILKKVFCEEESLKYIIKFRSTDHDGNNKAERARILKANKNVAFDGQYLISGGHKIGPNRGFGDFDFDSPWLYPGGVFPEEGGMIGRRPDINSVDLDDGDIVIVSSDGLLEILTAPGSLGPGRDEHEICEDVAQYMDEVAGQSSGRDSTKSDSDNDSSDCVDDDSTPKGLKSLSFALIEKKIARVTRSYMSYDPKYYSLSNSELMKHRHFPSYRKAVTNNMDNHVVVTFEIKYGDESSGDGNDDRIIDGATPDSKSPDSSTDATLKSSIVSKNIVDLDPDVKARIERLLKRDSRNKLKVSPLAELSGKFDKIQKHFYDIVFDMQCFQFLSKVDADIYVRNVRSMLKIDVGYVIVVAGRATDSMKSSNSNINEGGENNTSTTSDVHNKTSGSSSSSTFSNAIQSAMLKSKGAKSSDQNSDDGDWSDDDNKPAETPSTASAIGTIGSSAVSAIPSSSTSGGAISSASIDDKVKSTSSGPFLVVAAPADCTKPSQSSSISGPDRLTEEELRAPFERNGFKLVFLDREATFNETEAYELLGGAPPCFVAVFTNNSLISIDDDYDDTAAAAAAAAADGSGMLVEVDDDSEEDIYS